MQTAMSIYEGFLMFQELTMFPSPGCAGGLVTPKLLVLVLPNHQHTLEIGDRVSFQNFGKPSHIDVAVCVRKFH